MRFNKLKKPKILMQEKKNQLDNPKTEKEEEFLFYGAHFLHHSFPPNPTPSFPPSMDLWTPPSFNHPTLPIFYLLHHPFPQPSYPLSSSPYLQLISHTILTTINLTHFIMPTKHSSFLHNINQLFETSSMHAKSQPHARANSLSSLHNWA